MFASECVLVGLSSVMPEGMSVVGVMSRGCGCGLVDNLEIIRG